MYGATDLYSDWSWNIVKDKLCLNTGWSAGALYDRDTLGWRTGPELTLQYYTSGNAFIYAGPRRKSGNSSRNPSTNLLDIPPVVW